MAKRYMNKIFLSASIPCANRDEKFYSTADIIAIRDSVKALATVVSSKSHLVWGGHPSITPLIRYVINKMEVKVKDHMTIYQSEFFTDQFPEDNFEFNDIKITNKGNSKEESLIIMRRLLMEENEFKAGVFIGGMEGVLEEFNLFTKSYPNAKVLTVASTGGASSILYKITDQKQDKRLENDYAYMNLFKDLLNEYI